MQFSIKNETKNLLPGPAGDIETVLAPASSENPIGTTVIICHPHPLFGGTMNNKVVTTMAQTFHDLGMQTLRFNFRGVGQSTGQHDDGNGETDDVVAIADWLKTQSPQNTLWLAGFSFGGFVAAKAALRLPAKQLISVAPQISRFTSIDFPPLACPWLIIQGEQDEVISPEAVYAWVETYQPRPQLIRVPDAGHFFHRKLGQLRDAIIQGLDKK